MTLLDDPPPRTAPAAPPPSPALTGALAAIQATAASLVLVLAPTVLAWVTGTGSSATWQQAVRVAVSAWLAALGVDLQVAGGVYGLTPLGLTLLPLAACWLSARRMARALDPNGERIAGGFGRARARAAPPRAIITFVLVWVSLAAVLAAVAAMAAVRPVLWQAPIGAALVGGLGALAGSAAWEAGGLRRGLRLMATWLADLLRLPPAIRRLGRPAAVGVLVQLAGAAVVLGTAVLTSLPGILHLHHVLDPGIAGGTVLVLIQAMLMPNAVVWVAAFLAGPGFAVGTATSVTPAAAVLGPLPALPVLAALPQPGTLPGWTYCLLAVPFVAGACLGISAGRRGDHGRGPRASLRTAGDALAACLIASAVIGVLSVLSAGSAGPGRLAEAGPDGLLTGAILAAELIVGAFLGMLSLPIYRRVLPARTRGAPTSTDPETGDEAETRMSTLRRLGRTAGAAVDSTVRPVLKRVSTVDVARLTKGRLKRPGRWTGSGGAKGSGAAKGSGGATRPGGRR